MDRRPEWSPDGSQIAFISDRSGNWDIWVMEPDGTNPRQLTTDPADDKGIGWSPDGRCIAFHSDRSGNWDIWTMDADGTHPRQQTHDPATDSFPDWSPDGRFIAFQSMRSDNWDIWVTGVGVSELRQLTFDAADDSEPDWLPSEAGPPPPTSPPARRTATPSGARVFGPQSGSLVHDADGYIEEFKADVSVADFVAEATFFNPYSPSKGGWDYAFECRRPRSGTFHAVRIESDGDWYHKLVLDGEWKTVSDGHVSDLRTGADQSNHLRLVVLGDTGYLFVNEQFVASLDMSGLTDVGDVKVATGMVKGDEIEGEATRFEGFTVWSLDAPLFGPESGSLTHEPEDQYMEEYGAGVSVTDFVAEATFHNPYSLTERDWAHGFWCRRAKSGTLHAIWIEAGGKWEHWVEIGEDWTRVAGGDLKPRTGAGESNHLRVIVVGDRGQLFVNEQFSASLDMSGLTEAGDVRAVIVLREIKGKVTRFDDFTVWALD